MADAYINISQQLSPSDLFYINVQKQLQADIVTVPNIAIFTGASILQPTSLLPLTTVNNFDFYINRQHIPSSLVTFNDYVGGISITFDTVLMGFELETNDTIIAIGKFA